MKLLFRWLICLGVCFAPYAHSAQEKLNVLFIAVDDLRPQLGCYGVKDIHTPNLDALAKRGLLFNRAYCQQAVCSPSRTSLLTGRRPDTTRIYNLEDHFRNTIPDVVTLPQHFKNNGYFCQSFGKIYHGGLDDPKSWSAPSVMAKGGSVAIAPGVVRLLNDPDDLTEGNPPYILAANRPQQAPANMRRKKNGELVPFRGPPWSSPDVPDDGLGDGQIAERAIEAMEAHKDGPFFLAVGFRRPHLPFDAPKKYYDLYKLEDMKLASNPNPPKDVFAPAMIDWGELRNYKGMPQEGPVTDQQARELIRGYYAATSYTDAQIGRVLEALDRLKLRDKTIVIAWGDHGWQLGEHGMWCKHTCFETSTHTFMMISVPGEKHRGAKTDAFVEFVDVYPTLCDLAGLKLTDGLEGTSFAPLLDNPKKKWKSAAFSQYPRGNLMGYAMRTDRYRYVEWVPRNNRRKIEGRELYDHKDDADENVNVANRPDNRELLAKLSEQLHAGWRAAVPKP
jgi:iduronate 2-sulfatase